MKRIFLFMILAVSSVVMPKDGAIYSSGDALNGIKTIKVVFDVNIGDPSNLLLRLKLIEKTLRQIKEEGKDYVAVAAFRGKATDFVTKGDKYVPAELADIKRKIRVQINKLSLMGVVLHQCAIAAELRDVNLADILDEVRVVKNGYISIIGFQNKGYAFVPMD